MAISEKDMKFVEKLGDGEFERLSNIIKKTVKFVAKKTSVREEADFIFSRIVSSISKLNSEDTERKLAQMKEEDVDEDKVIEISELDRDTQKITKKRWEFMLARICFAKYLEKIKEATND